MGLTQYHHGIPFVVAVSFALWVVSQSGYSCYSISVSVDYKVRPDDRLGGCDSYLTGALRAFAGDTYRKPFYDAIYDTGIAFTWLFGIVFTVWYLARLSLLQRQNKVSVGWQIVFTFIPIVNFWAFYRIRKLRKYVLYVVVPSVVFVTAYLAYYFNSYYFHSFFGPVEPPVHFDPLVYALPQVIGSGLQGFAIYLVIIWSRQHNRNFDLQPAQTELQK
jgi:hypothetical protein